MTRINAFAAALLLVSVSACGKKDNAASDTTVLSEHQHLGEAQMQNSQIVSRNEFTPEMRAVLPMTDSLRAELGRMLEEHKSIGAATKRLADVARAEGNAPVADLAEKLSLHAKSEEELFYPVALLVGEIVRLKSGSAATVGTPGRP